MPEMNTKVASDFDYEATIEACARGDRLALRVLYDREARWLLGVAMRITRNHDTAQDVLQDAFLQIWQRASTYQRALGSGRGWLYTVVRHRALDEVRRRPIVVAVGDELESISDAVSSQADPVTHEIDGAFERCLQALEERQRECIVAAFVSGYTHAQIAKRLPAPLGSVKAWIRRGLLALKECLS